jgi:hypothetical protein
MPFTNDDQKRRDINNYLMRKYNPYYQDFTSGTTEPINSLIPAVPQPPQPPAVSTEVQPNAAAVGTMPDPYSEEERKRVVEGANQGNPWQAIPMALGGIGEALVSGGGGRANFVQPMMQNIEDRRKETITGFDEARNRAMVTRKYLEEKKAKDEKTDPKSAQNVALRATVRSQGIPVEETDTEATLGTKLEAHKAVTERMKIKPDVPAKPTMKPEDLRQNFIKETDQFRVTSEALDRLKIGSKANNKQGDTAMLYAYMKIINPGLAVREGGVLDLEQERSLPQIAQGMYRKLVSGDRLSPQERTEMLKTGKDMYAGNEKRYKQTRAQYETLAQQYEIDLGKYPLPEFGALPDEVAPPAGEVATDIPKSSETVTQEFATEAEAQASGLPSGTIVKIGGRKARLE